MIKRLLMLAGTTAMALIVLAVTASASIGPPNYNQYVSGYRTIGAQFRYVQAEFVLPNSTLCTEINNADSTTTSSPYGFLVSVEIGQNGNDHAGDLSLIEHPPASGSGCGTYTAAFAKTNSAAPPTPVALSPQITLSPGDNVQMSLYYSQANATTYANVTDLTTSKVEQGTFIHKTTYTETHIWAQLDTANGAFKPPASSFRALEFTNCSFTTYGGTKGTLTGPWTTNEWILTSDGTSSGKVEMTSPVVWNNGYNFGTWIEH